MNEDGDYIWSDAIYNEVISQGWLNFPTISTMLTLNIVSKQLR